MSKKYLIVWTNGDYDIETGPIPFYTTEPLLTLDLDTIKDPCEHNFQCAQAYYLGLDVLFCTKCGETKDLISAIHTKEGRVVS